MSVETETTTVDTVPEDAVSTEKLLRAVRRACTRHGWCSTAEDYLRDNLGLAFEPVDFYDETERGYRANPKYKNRMTPVEGSPLFITHKALRDLARVLHEDGRWEDESVHEIYAEAGVSLSDYNDTYTVTLTVTTKDLVNVGWFDGDESEFQNHLRHAARAKICGQEFKVVSTSDPKRPEPTGPNVPE